MESIPYPRLFLVDFISDEEKQNMAKTSKRSESEEKLEQCKECKGADSRNSSVGQVQKSDADQERKVRFSLI